MPGIEGLLVGRELGGRYRIEEVIGRGGMGAVYRAIDERLGRPVALKVITVGDSGDPEARERLRARFFREARSAAALPHHPNVVPVYDYGSDETLGLDYLVMELLRGSDLATRLARATAPDLSASLKILLEAARGLAVGHRQGLIHRDIKPGNIFLTQPHENEIQVRVVDFGIAKVADDEDTLAQLTQDGRAPHSPAYASPEQLRGLSNLTPASDVFSLGAVGFQLLTGQRPYSENDRNRMSLGVAVEAPSIRQRNPAVPAAIDDLIQKALDYDPTRRFQDAGEMADALQRAIRQMGETTIDPYIAGSSIVTGTETIRTADEDDRTQLLDQPGSASDVDDRTLLAPQPSAFDRDETIAAEETEAVPPPAATPRVQHTPAAEVPRERAPIQPRPAIQGPKRHQRSRSGIFVWSMIAILLGAAGVVVYNGMDDGDLSMQLPEAPDSVDIEVPDPVTDEQPEPDEPTEVDAYRFNRDGMVFFDQGRFDAALERFTQAVETSPLNADYHRNLGLAMLRLNRTADAGREFQRAIELGPERAAPYESLSLAQLASGDTAGAIRSLESYLERVEDPRNESIVRERIEYLRATVQERSLPPLLGERVRPDSSVSDPLSTPNAVPPPTSSSTPGNR